MNEKTNIKIKEVRNLANSKRNTLKHKSLSVDVVGKYDFKIAGIGRKAIKLDIYLDYGKILLNKNKKGSIEKRIYTKLLESPKHKLDTSLDKQFK